MCQMPGRSNMFFREMSLPPELQIRLQHIQKNTDLKQAHAIILLSQEIRPAFASVPQKQI